MELREPKAKKRCHFVKQPPLPIIVNELGEIRKFRGEFDGCSVVITDYESMEKVYTMGFFGKGSLSRSYPMFKKNEHSDSDDESLNLTLEEAFFLQSAVKCLDIIDQNTTLNSSEAWDKFSNVKPSFQLKYVVYYHFRSKNWVVKSGVKFGGDFLLYKDGPAHYHASYVVVIRNTCDTLDAVALMGKQRMCETAGKELLICQVTFPQHVLTSSDLPNVELEEILMKRWVPSNERQQTV